MDLDFSFALVSSLTPRRKADKSSPSEALKKTRPLKTKIQKAQKREEIFHKKSEEKENFLPKEQLMKKDEFLKPAENKQLSNSSSSFNGRESNTSDSFSVNMENIAVRRNQTRGKKKNQPNPLQLCGNVLKTSDGNVVGKTQVASKRLSEVDSDIINISSDIDESSPRPITSYTSKSAKGELLLNTTCDSSLRSSLDIVEGSSSEVMGDIFDNCRNLRSLSARKNKIKTQPTRTSGVSETSLSTAYDSDSFQAIRRQGTKVILETPETDQSLRETLDKRKSSLLSVTSEDREVCNLKSTGASESPKKNVKRKSSELSESPDENKKRYNVKNYEFNVRSIRNSSLSSCVLEKNKPSGTNENDELKIINIVCDDQLPNRLPKASGKNIKEVRIIKKLRSSNDLTDLDMFKLESTIRDQSPISKNTNEVAKTKTESTCLKDYKDLSKGKKTKRVDSKKPNLLKDTDVENKELTRQKKCVKQKPADGNVSKNNHCSLGSPKMSTLILPSEVIPKFEHINQWLKDTQEKATSSSDINLEKSDVISIKDIMPVKNKYKISLSPRIKKKKEKAKTSLEEEQKLFEELYGDDYNKRVSTEVDEVASSCRDSVEFSENVLDKLYGTVWQKDTATTQSEPRKGRKKKTVKNKTPATERKKHRTSIYEVFSSSSSEDRFEEFLENVQRGKVKSNKRRSGRPGTPDFINDSDSEDNGSLDFYQNILSSAVKDDINTLKKTEIKPSQDTHKVNRRRLSFGSSKDDGCSESAKSDTKLTAKGKKSSNKDKSKPTKSRSKKTNKHVEGKGDGDIDVFSLVTPLKIKGKKAESDLSEKINNLIPSEVPRSVGKTKTPKNPKPKDPSSEERLKTKYLDSDFKAPKSTLKTFKTPSKSVKPMVPSSPALSFLSSLSEMTAGLPCHPDALIYKNNFKTKREELTKRLFTLYNKEVFDQQLPSDMLIQWNSRMTSTSGYCYNKRIYRDNQILRSSRIVLSTKILDRADRLRDTLIHELCHAATWIVNATSDGHGPIWRSWADKANRRFPELPVIKRCHDYAITTKFTYKCMTCGYCIGRHSKSLDTERKRCGFCFGKFQVFITAKMASASVTSGSDSVKTPRNPTGFALFVKENYAIVKKENNVPHAQVMKLLSQKFAEVKISKQNADDPILIE